MVILYAWRICGELMNFATPQNVNLETEASIAPQYRRKYNSCEPIQN